MTVSTQSTERGGSAPPDEFGTFPTGRPELIRVVLVDRLGASEYAR